jgi:hypothetical protein
VHDLCTFLMHTCKVNMALLVLYRAIRSKSRADKLIVRLRYVYVFAQACRFRGMG